ncbi:hypothetical protein BDM02DRAFT_3114239, partial [Thelephora ganbajun]
CDISNIRRLSDLVNDCRQLQAIFNIRLQTLDVRLQTFDLRITNCHTTGLHDFAGA